MEIKGKIEKVSFISGTFNTLGKMLSWTDILPMGCTTEKFTKFDPYKVEREQHVCVVMLIKTE